MERRMNDVVVRIEGKDIVIEQLDPLGNHDDRIVVTSQQVELLCGWLLDAKHEMEATA